MPFRKVSVKAKASLMDVDASLARRTKKMTSVRMPRAEMLLEGVNHSRSIESQCEAQFPWEEMSYWNFLSEGEYFQEFSEVSNRKGIDGGRPSLELIFEQSSHYAESEQSAEMEYHRNVFFRILKDIRMLGSLIVGIKFLFKFL